MQMTLHPKGRMVLNYIVGRNVPFKINFALFSVSYKFSLRFCLEPKIILPRSSIIFA